MNSENDREREFEEWWNSVAALGCGNDSIKSNIKELWKERQIVIDQLQSQLNKYKKAMEVMERASTCCHKVGCHFKTGINCCNIF